MSVKCNIHPEFIDSPPKGLSSVDPERSVRISYRYVPVGPLAALVPKLISYVHDTYARKRSGAYEAHLETTLRSVIANFANLWLYDPFRILAISRTKEDYDNHPVWTWRSMDAVLKGLCTGGYIECVFEGRQGIDGREGRTTRYAMTSNLHELFQCAEIRPCHVVRTPRPETSLIELRSRKQLDEFGDEMARTPVRCPREYVADKRAMARNVRRINQALKECFIGLRVTDNHLDEIQASAEDADYTDFHKTDLYRVLTCSLDEWGRVDLEHTGNGRFFGGWWINIPSKAREHITIATPGSAPESVVSLDFSAALPRIAYAKYLDQECPKYPYTVFSDGSLNERLKPVIKIALLTMLNAKNRREARKAIIRRFNREILPQWFKDLPIDEDGRPMYSYNEEVAPLNTDQRLQLMSGDPEVSIDEIIEQIENTHAALFNLFYQDAGMHLMSLEARIMERVQLRAIDELGTVVLPIHDAVLCKRSVVADVKQLLKYESIAVAGFEIPVTEEQLDEDVQAELPGHVYRTLLEDWQQIKDRRTMSAPDVKPSPASDGDFVDPDGTPLVVWGSR